MGIGLQLCRIPLKNAFACDTGRSGTRPSNPTYRRLVDLWKGFHAARVKNIAKRILFILVHEVFYEGGLDDVR